MNELQKYVDSLPMYLSEAKKIELIEQWKKDNNWGQEKSEPAGTGTVLKPEETKDEEFKPFDLEEVKKIDPVVETETSTGSTNTVSDSADGSLDLEKNWNNNFAANIKTININELSPEKFLALTEKAVDNLTASYSENEDYSINNAEIILESNRIFNEEIVPNVRTDEDTFIEKIPFIGVNPFTDFLGDLIRASKTGWAQSDIVDPAFDLMNNGSNTSDEEVLNYINANKEIAKEAKVSDEMRNFLKIYEENGSGVWGFIKGTIKNPSILPSLFISSMASQVGAATKSEEVALAAGVGAGGGAAVGSVVPVIGTGIGAMSGMFAGGATAMESAMTFSELLQEEIGEKELTVEAVKNILEDEEKLNNLKRKAYARGLTIGMVEGLTSGVAKGVGGKLVKAGFKPKTVVAVGGSIEAAGGSLGEVGGRLAAGQEMDVAEIGFEGITGLSTAPITVGSSLINLNNKIASFKVKKEIKNSPYENITEVFNDGSTLNDIQIKATQIKGSETILNNKIKSEIKSEKITIDESKAIKKRFIDIQGSVNQLKPLGISIENQPALVDLMIEQKNLKNTIKQVDNSSLTKAESARLSEIDAELGDLITKDKSEKIDIGAKKIAEEIGVGFESFETQEDVDSAIATLQEEGGKIDAKNSDNYGTFITLPENKSIIILNKETATEDRMFTEGQHETGHAVVYETVKNKPEAAIALGQALLNEIRTNKDINIKPGFQARLDQYIQDVDVSQADTMEEVMTLVSDGLTNGTIEINETIGVKLGNFIRRALSAMGMKVKFKNGKDVLNFIKDYNRSVHRQKGLSRGLKKTAIEGAEVTITPDTITETEIKESVAKESKKDTGVEASTKVQKIYEAQGVDGAFDIIEQFKPIVSRIVEKRSEAPNFDRQLLTDEIETGKRGILDLIKEYKPESGVPLAAYVNKFLPARAIEASQRVLGEEFTTDVTEAKGVAAEEVTTEVSAKPVTRKIKPSSFISKDAVTQIKEQIQGKIKDIDPKNLTFKKLGDLAPEIIAAEIGIPVKKLTVPAANLSKADATAIQQFVNKNADKLLKILPEGAVVEAATDKLLGTSTGVPKGLLDAFYTKKTRLTKGAGLSPFVLNKGITKAKFLEAFGIVDGKKQEGFNARSSQAQALKGIANLYGRLVTNEIVRSDTDLSLEAKQDVAAGKNKSMASKRFDNQFFLEQTFSSDQIATLKKLSTLRDKNALGKLLDFKTKTINEETRAGLVANMLVAFKNPEYNLSIMVLQAAKAESGGIQSFYGNITKGKFVPNKKGKKYIKTTDGKYILASRKKSSGITNWVPRTGKLFYGQSDPNYQAIVKVARKYDGPKFQKISIPRGKNQNKVLDKKWKEKQIEKEKNNKIVRKDFVNELAEAHKKGLSLDIIGSLVIQSYQATSGLIKVSASFDYVSKVLGYGTGRKQGPPGGVNTYREEHNPPASVAGASIMFAIKYNKINPEKGIIDLTNQALDVNYYQTQLAKFDDQKLDQAKLEATLPEGFTIFNNPIVRLAAAGIDLNTIINISTGKTIAETFNAGIPAVIYDAYNANEKLEASAYQNEQVIKAIKDPNYNPKKNIKVFQKLVPGKSMASKRDSNLIPNAIKYDRPITVQTAVNALEKTDKALNNARKLDQPVKKIRVFDFDDTLAKSKSMVIVNLPDGSSKKINATQFAQQASDLESQGAEFDFTEFSKVVEGKKGPLFEVAQKIADARGTEDVFILTARPQNADGPIKAFMKANGIDIPLKNITGLGDGTAEAKAGWIMGKAAEGYNDFYFADDAIKNVKAVKDVLSQIDVKSEVQLAKASKRTTFDTIVNDMIEDSAGIETYKQYSAARAKTVGANKGKFNFFIPASAEDFTGLLYKMLGKGKRGDAQMAFLKANLLDPYDRAESAVTQAKIAAANDFKALKTNLKTLPTSLSKPTGIGGFTFSHAVRVSIWSKQGMTIPGLSKKDIKELNDFVNNNAELSVFTDELMKIQKGKPYPKPGDNWLGGNITSDIINDINKVNRAEYQQEWRENVDIIFSENNMNKMEAAYGTRWREAMEDSLRRMKSGSNRPPGGNRVTNSILDWLNNSVGAVMFLNTRSALLQTISSVNFINWGDNNIVKAGLAFANQKQFWSDFMTLMNSDYLVERRNGLKINVSESEIADAVRDSKNKVKAAIAFLLSKGFVMTRFADSFAIAAGGSTFYRNRVKSLLEKGGFKKPQVIFLTGAAGSGKTTAAKNFGKNWVIVNKDVEMEALMKKAGLPSDLNKLTREQRGKWRKIQEQASKNTLAEIKKLKEQGKNIIIDDTGSSEAAVSRLKRELEKSGYESKMLLLGTSLEQSLKRNKARKQRTLTDVTVKNSFEALMGNKKRYKEIFKDNFTEATDGKISNNLISKLTGKISQKDAEAQAFDDFRQIAEESQQSSNPNRISAQQASGAGRVILAWANTPMQYARIQKRAAQDLVNKRGDWKTNVSKIVYYGAIQNLIFNALQQAVFALGFGEDDDEEKQDAKKNEKIARIANGMIDSQLKGLGIGGAAVVALKSALMELGKQHAKDRSKYEEAVFDLLGFSPPLGSKIQKINSGLRSFSWNMKDIKSKGFSLDNPAYLAGAQITTGLTNVPFDRVMKKLNSMRGIVNEQSALWQKVALGLGWSTWDVGLGYYGGFDAAQVLTPEEQAIEDVNTMKKETKTKEQIDMLLDLGLTKKEIKALGKEQQRVEKIIELQKEEVTPEVKSEVKPKSKVEEVKKESKQKTKPKKESSERRLRRQFDSIKDENKPEQVKTLLDFGLSKKQIRALQYEKNRVEKILELMYKNKKK